MDLPAPVIPSFTEEAVLVYYLLPEHRGGDARTP
jgi:hypothetical protein